MSEICDGLGCTPDVALRQDVLMVTRIFAYRAAQQAKALFNAKDKSAAYELLRANPHLLEVLSMMSRAQRGLPLRGRGVDHAAEGIAIAGAYQADEEEVPPAD